MKNTYFFLFFITFIFSCTSEDPSEILQSSSTDFPIIMMHGALGSGDTYASQAQRFVSNGYSEDQLFVFDWNSLDMAGTPELILDEYIDEILMSNQKNKVILIGHSAGGNLGYTYLENESRAAKVDRYIHVGSFQNIGPAGPNGEIPTLNLYSTADEVVEGGDIPGAANVAIDELDHYQIATSSESFIEFFKFLNNGNEPNNDIIEDNEIFLSGRVVDLGSNEPESEVKIEIYEIAGFGGRAEQVPIAELTTDINGNWGPWEATKEQRYEFVISKDDPDFRKLHYYREGFVKSDPFVYLRSFPPPTSQLAIVLNQLPVEDDQSVFAVFSSSRAVINGRDELDFNQIELSTPELASADQTTIAFFVYDGGDLQTSEDGHFIFSLFPFLNGIDIYTTVESCLIMPVTLNGVTLHAENWKSSNEGFSILIFN